MFSKLREYFRGNHDSGTQDGTLYVYEVRDFEGKARKGQLKAFSLKEAVRILEKHSLSIVSLEKAPYKEVIHPERIDPLNLMIFFRELSIMVDSGLSLRRALAVLAQQQSDKTTRSILESLLRSIEGGLPLSGALGFFPKTFSRFHQGLVRAGETGGFMSISLNYLAGAMEKEIYLKKKLKAALNYPLMVSAMGAAFLLMAFYWCLPYVRVLVRDLNLNLPLLTRILLAVADIMTRYYVILPIIAVALFIYYNWNSLARRFLKDNQSIDKLFLSIPIVRDIIKSSLIIQTFIVLEALIGSGVNIVHSIRLSGEICENKIMRDILSEVAEAITRGKTLSDGLAAYPAFFSRTVISMIIVGEESGEMRDILNRIIQIFTVELDTIIESFTKLVEPLAIAMMGLVMGAVVILFFMPIYTALNQAL